MGSGVERILLGVTGGIAAYKSAEIVRRLDQSAVEFFRTAVDLLRACP